MKQLIETYLDKTSDLITDCKNDVWELIEDDPLADDDLQKKVDARFNQLFDGLKPLDRALLEMEIDAEDAHATIIDLLDKYSYSESETEDILEALEVPRSLLMEQLRESAGGGGDTLVISGLSMPQRDKLMEFITREIFPSYNDQKQNII